MNAFEILRAQITVDSVVSLDGHGGKVLCISPGHSEVAPSMHVYADHVHCYGCGFHGDVTDVWAALHGFDRPIEAALDLAREFNVTLPEMGPEARQKATRARSTEDRYARQARAMHSLLETSEACEAVREWWEARGFGEELREWFLLGSNGDGTEAVIPFWHHGRIKGLIRRKLEGEPKYILPSAKELPDGHKPLFVPGTLSGGEVFLVEGYIDALAAAAAGKSVVAVGGTKLSEPQQDELAKVPGTIYILPDTDKAGAEAVRQWARDLYPRARICSASYGADEHKDAADHFAHAGPEKTAEHLSRLVDGARDLLDLELDEAANLELEVRERLAHATKHIVPLLVPIHPAGLQDATTDIVAEKLKLKKSWLNKAIKDENERLSGEQMAAYQREREVALRRKVEEYRQLIAEAQPEIDALFKPGVLARLRDTAAAMHNVHGDKDPLELALLVALGAQLAPLPNGRPLGASILLTAEAGRGKNHIVDAAVKPLPEEFYFAFEIASGQSLYYAADEDPEFMKHTFAYPNEIEGAEALWEFFRPMLSKGWAKKIVTAKDAAGNMISRTIIVEGPITIAIPTIRNKTDQELQTRLLIAELPDYPGRVKHHAATLSEQLVPAATAANHSREQWLWQEGLRQLTDQRRVAFPLKHPDFALDDDQVSHGARLWANLLGLMVTHAWLEQRSRRLLDLAGEGGESSAVAIEATPDDYEAAYRVFTKVCKRTVVNLSEAHRKIVGALYDLHEEFPNREGFTQREIAKVARVSQSVVSDHKTFLVMSAKLLKETDGGLTLVEGAEPSWWASTDLMKGLPTPEKVRSWWKAKGDPPPKPPDHADHTDHAADKGQKPHTYAGNSDRKGADQAPISDRAGAEHPEAADHDRRLIADKPISERGIRKPKTGDDDSLIRMIGKIGGSEDENGKCPPGTPHGAPHGYPCDDYAIDTLFGAGVLADNCASCGSAETGHGEQGELCEECAVAEGAL